MSSGAVCFDTRGGELGHLSNAPGPPTLKRLFAPDWGLGACAGSQDSTLIPAIRFQKKQPQRQSGDRAEAVLICLSSPPDTHANASHCRLFPAELPSCPEIEHRPGLRWFSLLPVYRLAPSSRSRPITRAPSGTSPGGFRPPAGAFLYRRTHRKTHNVPICQDECLGQYRESGYWPLPIPSNG